MALNVTLFAQAVVFAFLAWFTMRYIWPPLMSALGDREQRISAGLADADEGRRILKDARELQIGMMEENRRKAEEIVAQAQRRSTHIEEEARRKAEEVSKYIVAEGRAEVRRERAAARRELGSQLATLALAAAGRILGHEVNAKRHAGMLSELTREFPGGAGDIADGTS